MKVNECDLTFHVGWNAQVCRPSEIGAFAANVIRYVARKAVDESDGDA